jgi:hypothetical protein
VRGAFPLTQEISPWLKSKAIQDAFERDKKNVIANYTPLSSLFLAIAWADSPSFIARLKKTTWSKNQNSTQSTDDFITRLKKGGWNKISLISLLQGFSILEVDRQH